MKKFIRLFPVSCILLLIGCKPTPKSIDQWSVVKTEPLSKEQVVTPSTSDYGRFQLVQSAYLYALDTKTGLLCRTLNENPNIPKGFFPLGAKPVDMTPLCLDLSQDEAQTIKAVRGH